MWTINKPNSVSAIENSFAPAAPTNLLISGNVGNNSSATLVPLNIVAGNVLQTGGYNLSLASLSLASGTSFVNEYSGTITLGGDVSNEGLIRLNANGAGCQADSILLRSTNAECNEIGTVTGIFRMVDVNVGGQSGMPIITVYSGTDAGNNGANWVFDSNCATPTAASANVGGRVTNSLGRGIGNVRVAVDDSHGNSSVAVTNPFGFYKFMQISAGQSVIISVRSKRFCFCESDSERLLYLSDLDGINFTRK